MDALRAGSPSHNSPSGWRRPAARPLIGVTTSEVRAANDVERAAEGEPPRNEMALGLTYMRAIEVAGGLPVVIPPLKPDAINPMLDQLAGICLSGGPDLDPATYARRAHPKLGPTWPELDQIEIALARGAYARNLPVLAICRGLQALNVARGGTLVQHLPDDRGVVHRQSDPGDRTTHSIRIESRSRLRRILGAEVEVNSFHHQAVDQVGAGLRPVAWAPDGTIEALEADDREFGLAVQWHAECIADAAPQLALFEAFIQTSSGSALRQAA
jgi:putative glutamine amidotransferase